MKRFFPCSTCSFNSVGRLVLSWVLIGVFSCFLIATPSAAGPKRGGTFVMALGGDPPNLNPNLVPGTITLEVSTNIFNLLVYLNFDFEIIPELAESWKVSQDGLTYTFNLVKNASWHDGKPVTSADVVYTLREVVPTTPRGGIWWTPNIVSVEAPDDYTVVVQLKHPYAPFLTLMANPIGGPHILPKHLYEGTDWKKNPYNNKPIGTGPFMFKKWARGDHIELVENPKYFRRGKEGKPYCDRLVFRIMPDSAARLLAIKKGEVDYLYSYLIPFEEISRLREDPGITADKRGNEALGVNNFLLFNLRRAPLSNELVRHAIGYAIDKEQIVKLVLGGEGQPAKSFVHSGLSWAHNPNVPAYKHDPKRANALLDKAGYSRKGDGTRFKLQLTANVGRPFQTAAAEVIRDQLKQVGIDLQIVSLDRAAIVDSIYMKWDFDMHLQLLATGPEPTINTTRFLHTRQIKKAAYVNVMGYSNPEVDKLLDLEFTQVDPKKRAATWHKIQEIAMNELPLIPVWEQPIANTYRSVWADVLTGPFGVYQTREHAYLKE